MITYKYIPEAAHYYLYVDGYIVASCKTLADVLIHITRRKVKK